jgi:hypothetical protein
MFHSAEHHLWAQWHTQTSVLGGPLASLWRWNAFPCLCNFEGWIRSNQISGCQADTNILRGWFYQAEMAAAFEVAYHDKIPTEVGHRSIKSMVLLHTAVPARNLEDSHRWWRHTAKSHPSWVWRVKLSFIKQHVQSFLQMSFHWIPGPKMTYISNKFVGNREYETEHLHKWLL